MKRYGRKEKECIVLKALKNPVATRFACEVVGVNWYEVANWILRYKAFGVDGLRALDTRPIPMIG